MLEIHGGISEQVENIFHLEMTSGISEICVYWQ